LGGRERSLEKCAFPERDTRRRSGGASFLLRKVGYPVGLGCSGFGLLQVAVVWGVSVENGVSENVPSPSATLVDAQVGLASY